MTKTLCEKKVFEVYSDFKYGPSSNPVDAFRLTIYPKLVSPAV